MRKNVWKIEILKETDTSRLETTEYTNSYKEALSLAKEAIKNGYSVEIWKLVRKLN